MLGMGVHLAGRKPARFVSLASISRGRVANGLLNSIEYGFTMYFFAIFTKVFNINPNEIHFYIMFANRHGKNSNGLPI
jgi:hypothetical protein